MKKLFWLFPILFLIDNILGLNGYQFTVFGIGIRILLFGLSAVSLFLYCIYTVRAQKICLTKKTPGQTHFLRYCKPIDGVVAGFLCLNFLWATVIPVMQGGSLRAGIKDFSTLLVLVLYFPCAFLMRTGQLRLRSLLKWLYPLLLILSLWHSVMYIGEILAPGFYESYYDFIDYISFGTAVRTDVVLGFGITRIIQVTSVFLIPAMLLSLEDFTGKLRIFSFAALALSLFAVLITYTKSIWYGILAGIALAILGILLCCKDATMRKRVLVFGGALVLLFSLFNFVCLDNTVLSRAFNVARADSLSSLDAQIADLQQQLSQMQPDDPSDPSGPSDPNGNDAAEDLAQQIEKLQHQMQDIAGTQEANAQRAQQQEALLNKWSGSKLLGYGYGAYAEDCIRNESFPYMYENLLPAMLMKLGLVGMLGWGLFVLALVIFAVKAMWKKPVRFWCWLGTALAYAMAVQTNPFLFTFAGISLMLYLLLYLTGTQEEC